MDHADSIMCVSELTRQTVIHKYYQDPRKVFTVRNAVWPFCRKKFRISRREIQKIKSSPWTYHHAEGT